MQFELTETQKEMQKKVREFAEKEIVPKAAELDRTGEFPEELWQKLREEGFFGLTAPKEYGGRELDYLSYILVVEELSKALAAIGVIYEVHESLVTRTILREGTESQKKEFAVPLIAGNAKGAFALTEPNAGTDAASQETTAVKDGSDYIINGRKHFIVNASVADIFIVFAMTDKAQGTRGISAILMPKETLGFSVTRIFEKMGLNNTLTGEIEFENCRVPQANLLGQEGKGFKIAMATLDDGRIGIGAQSVGIAQAALDASVDFAKKRIAFGKPIAAQQGIQWHIAEMKAQLEGARLLTYSAAAKVDSGKRFSLDAAMAKLIAAEASVDITRKAVQVHGGFGYMKDYPVERYYRDAKITEIYEGTSEVQKMVIAGTLLR